MVSTLEQISLCIQKGKTDLKSPFPPDMREQLGADELTAEALKNGISANEILTQALIPAMGIVGGLFRDKKLFVPQVLMSARAMNMSLAHLKPFFSSGDIQSKGTFIIGTVAGDLHDIGKNLVSMMVEGCGWNVIDLGVDVSTDSFLEAIEAHPDSALGMSALLTTTMESMATSVEIIKEKYPKQIIVVGGAPVNANFAASINADFYAADSQCLVEYLNTL